ncbi:hypothetical protein B4166_3135 [Caldibacillus thermoamylovorans]|uniref:Uncharacterized protein n=1 Tax=Caldibacillus thermoamylovorans TaxID=35841 RepID=A0ABD4A3P7_9BACI|nr:hypothetical protein B4166_3135 [Caldibacillus thermoamylovorans]KIO71663.1 hypothetical protein B4167_3507 [Caldibacillus thermoamylovorans]
MCGQHHGNKPFYHLLAGFDIQKNIMIILLFLHKIYEFLY